MIRPEQGPKARKEQLRALCRARGAALTAEYRAQADAAIRAAVSASAAWRQAEGVFLYVSVRTEPDTRALIDLALREGKRVYVPRCLPGGVMQAARVRSAAGLRAGAFGIPEPDGGAEAAEPGDFSLAVVPCAAAGRGGERLGHGAGYYDRFLRAFPCATLCLCHEALLVDGIPMEADDVRMDCVVTERGIYRKD